MRLPALWPLAAGVCLAALWPLSAYAVGPLVLPAAVLLAGVALVIARRPEYGIAVVLALAPWTNMTIPSPEGAIALPPKPLHLLLPVLTFGLAAFVMVLRSERRSDRGAMLMAPVLVLVGVALAASVGALEPAESVKKVVVLLTAAALLFATLQICREPGQLGIVVGGGLVGLGLGAAQGDLQQVLGLHGEYGFVSGPDVVRRVQGSFGHPNQYGGYLAMLLPLAAAVAVGRRLPTGLRVLAGAAFALALPALVFSYARGAILGVALGSLAWLWVVRPRAAVSCGVALAVAALALAPGALKERFETDGSGGDVALRADIWNAALEIYAERPILGVGVNNFATAYATLPSTLSAGTQRRLLHQRELLTPPHAQNLYLNVLAEQGLVGLVALLWVGAALVVACRRAARAADPLARAVGVGLGAGVATLAVHSLLDVSLPGEAALPLLGLGAVAAALASSPRPARAAAATAGA